MLKILVLVVASVLGAILYRMGGAGEQWGKNNKLWRRIGVPLVCVTFLVLFGSYHIHSLWGILAMVCTMGFLVGANSSYWTFNDTDATALNWFLVGLFNSVALIPYILVSHLWIPYIVRSVVVTGLITFWSLRVDNAVREELGRGFIIVSTLGCF